MTLAFAFGVFGLLLRLAFGVCVCVWRFRFGFPVGGDALHLELLVGGGVLRSDAVDR